ncbi:hypothetical protein [Nitrosovibrio sp. Nv17]|uniref:hypothetical protein n=1 Tax=Nitrosovibrio sp. Nv17 TaxID=1855339 RepID=UPI000A6936F1|nr:hypothetical protein [Nitrosovibrio sp. Nv17]
MHGVPATGWWEPASEGEDVAAGALLGTRPVQGGRTDEDAGETDEATAPAPPLAAVVSA